MPMLNCYVDDETMARLREVARTRTDMTFPTEADVDEVAVKLAENAIAEAAMRARRGC